MHVMGNLKLLQGSLMHDLTNLLHHITHEYMDDNDEAAIKMEAPQEKAISAIQPGTDPSRFADGGFPA